MMGELFAVCMVFVALQLASMLTGGGRASEPPLPQAGSASGVGGIQGLIKPVSPLDGGSGAAGPGGSSVEFPGFQKLAKYFQ